MAAGSVNPAFFSQCKPVKNVKFFTPTSQASQFSTKKTHVAGALRAVAKEQNLIPIKNNDCTDHQSGVLVSEIEREVGGQKGHLIGGDDDGRLSFDKVINRGINASIVLAAGTFAITRLLTIDHDYWHGWTIYEILRYAPQHNWSAYEEALKEHPVLAKMMISGVVYSIGDWIAQCCEGKPLLEFDRTRIFRSGLVGFALHGSLSHYYYYIFEALFPFEDWWAVLAKVAFDQTVWAAVWNSIYYIVLGLLRFESVFTILGELKTVFWPMLTSGWKLWPFAHVITYGVVPIEQRLLWVDCVELIWVTILSTLSNEKWEARISEAPTNPDLSSTLGPPEE